MIAARGRLPIGRAAPHEEGMTLRFGRSLRARASAALAWLVARLEDLGLWLLRITRLQRRARREAGRLRAPPRHADERAARRIAEAQRGGLSSAESAARYARGENPGGMHHKAARRDEGPERLRPAQEEPQERKERVPGGERHMAAVRRGG
jgi:hypothetical protein